MNFLFNVTAPTQPTPVAPEPIQDEHKTLVYVFVKNPSTEEPETNAQETSTEPSKPEVFFVKYKENEETEETTKETNEKL